MIHIPTQLEEGVRVICGESQGVGQAPHTSCCFFVRGSSGSYVVRGHMATNNIVGGSCESRLFRVLQL